MGLIILAFPLCIITCLFAVAVKARKIFDSCVFGFFILVFTGSGIILAFGG